jgi:hypothetical protein
MSLHVIIVKSNGISKGKKASRGREKVNTNMKSFRLEAGFEPTTNCNSHEFISACNNLASKFHF